MQNSSLSSVRMGLGAAFGPISRPDSRPQVYALDQAEQGRIGADKRAAERQFRAAFLRQLLEPLTRELISTPASTGGVGSGMETYRFFLEEALAGHLERQWPLPTLDLDPVGDEARRAADVQRAAAAYAVPSAARTMSALAPRLSTSAPTLSTSAPASGSTPASTTVSRSATAPVSMTGVRQSTDSRSSPPWGETQLSRSIQRVAESHSLPDSLLRAVVEVESGGRVDAVSPAGAQGLMQLMPATAAELGVTNPFDPKQNLEGGARYLAEQLERFDGDLPLALAAYNAGPGAVRRHGGIPPYPETKRYIESVLAWKSRFDSGSKPGALP